MIADIVRGRRVRFIVATAVCVLLAGAPLFLSPYVNFQLSMVAVFAVAVLGLNIVMGFAGQISLSQSAFMGLGAYVAGYGALHQWPVVVTFVLSCLIPAAVGLIIALPIAGLRGYAFAMVTLGLPLIAIPLAIRLKDFTGGSYGMTVDWMHAPGWSGLADDQWRFYVIVIIAAVFFILARNLVGGRIGRAFEIVRDNESVATSMGISSYRYKVLAFTISALYGGLAGFLYLIAVQFMSTQALSFVIAINLLAAMVIGGSASIVGSIIGGAFYVVVPYLSGLVDASQTAMYSGLALLIVLFVVPGGLVTLPQVLRRLRARRFGHRKESERGDGSVGALAGLRRPNSADSHERSMSPTNAQEK